MSALRAVLGKDLRQFRSGTGLIALLLPLVLLIALRAGAGDLMSGVCIEPFPIAVRDEDGTVMSRSLTNQVAEVELFSQVIRAQQGETDAQLLERGCAAVITIPKDFFYTMYSMNSDTVQVVLNEDMPLESSLLRSVLASVMGIISADQAVGRAVFHFCYGTLSEQQQRELWNENSQQLLQDALGRQQVFDQSVEAADVQGSLERGLLACALSVLCLFFPLSAVKTLPEEFASGILPRFLAAGGRLWVFFLSKFLTAALLTAPSLILLLAAFRPESWQLVVLLAAVLFIGAFGLFLCITAWSGEAGSAQRWGNLVLLLSLVLGGALYASELLPLPVQAVGRLTLPYYARRGLEAIREGTDVVGLLSLLWPVLAGGCGLGLLSLPGFVRTRHRRTPPPMPKAVETQFVPAAVPRLWRRLWPVALRKLRAMSGGAAGLVCLLLTAALCGSLAACALAQEGPEALHLAVALEDDGPLAAQLVEQVAAQEHVDVQFVSAREGRALLVQGRAEGLLIVGAGYDTALEMGEGLPLSYESAAASVSAQAAREIVAGQAIAQQARLRGLLEAEERLGHALEESERTQLLAEMEQEEMSAEPLYAATTLSGGSIGVVSLLAPGQFGFAALAVMLTLLTWAAWTGRIDARRVERRMAALPSGLALSYGGDVLALILVGAAVGLCALLPGGWPEAGTLLTLLAYTACVAGLSLALARLSAFCGRMDALAPFVALITCLVGGCFGDLGQFSRFLRTLSLFTPQGLALRATVGNGMALAVLALAAAILLWLGAPKRESPE